MKNVKFLFLGLAVIAMFLTSCEKDVYEQPAPPAQEEEVQSEASLKSGSYYANYYPNSAVSYALDWTEETGSMTDVSSFNNSGYKDYAPNDCANFVSQCLYAGGLYTDGTWWTGFKNSSPVTWVNVQALYNYLTGSAYSINTQILTYPSSVTSYINSIHTGDVVFYYSTLLSKFSHVTLVTSKTSLDARVSGHTANQRNHSLRYYLQNEKSNSNDYVVVLHFN